MGGDDIAMQDFIDTIMEIANNNRLINLLTMSTAVRAGNLSGKKGQEEYTRWRREIEQKIGHGNKKTLFDRLKDTKEEQTITLFDKLRKGR